MATRIPFVDQLKAISIILIVYIHNDFVTILSSFFNTFNLHLFFILSGFVRKDPVSVTFWDFVRRNGRRLLLPYFSIAFVLFFLWIFVGRHYGNSVSYDPWKNFIGIFYAQGGASFMDWGAPLWFLPALFCLLIIDYIVCRLKPSFRWGVVVLLVLVGYLIGKFVTFRLPWSLDVAMVAYPFFVFGILLRVNFRLDRFRIVSRWLIMIAAFGLHMLLWRFNSEVAFYYAEYGNLLLLYVNGLLGFIWVFLFFGFLPVLPPLLWLGRNTLPILAFHLSALALIKAVALLGFDSSLPSGISYYWLYTTLQIIILIPLVLFLNRFAPWMVGLSGYGLENKSKSAS